MNISNYTIITGSDTPYGHGRTPADVPARARSRADQYADEAGQQHGPSAPAATLDAVAETRSVVPVGNVVSSARRSGFYQVEDLSRFPMNQRKALQTYTTNQGLSMLDANADYLGAIDTYA